MDQLSGNHDFMKRCLELARKGRGRTGLNPLVGCVIVHDGKIIGEGYHQKYGGPHAEVHAIRSVKNPELLKSSVLYVNLEPCSHFGKTPPCSRLIIESKIPEVFIGCKDPNPKVSGNGIKALRQAGIHVSEGVLENACIDLNRKFFVNIMFNRPYIILKWAQSRDHFLDVIRTPESATGPNWITNHTSRMLVHKWRGEEDAILAGTNTIIADNPALNLREWSGKQPIRICIDRNNRIPSGTKIKDGTQPTLIFTEAIDDQNAAFYQKMDTDMSLKTLVEKIYKMGISSLIVEGGALLLNSFINNQLWDEARVFTGNVFFREGITAPSISDQADEVIRFRNNQLSIFVNQIPGTNTVL